MGAFVLVLIVLLVVIGVVFGIFALLSGDDPGLSPAEADHAVPLPGNRPLQELDVSALRFDTALRGYRMAQVDRALRRAAYDIGYKDEMIAVLEAEVTALREGRTEEAELMRKAREAAASTEQAYVDPETLLAEAEELPGDELPAEELTVPAAEELPVTAEGEPLADDSELASAIDAERAESDLVSAEEPTVAAAGGRSGRRKSGA